MSTGSLAANDQPPGSEAAGAKYLRELEESLRYWYSAAETKAQVVLTLNGVFLAFLSGSLLTNRERLKPTVGVFGPETWGLLAGMAAALVGSIVCAVACLMARGVWPWEVNKDLAAYEVRPDRPETYRPEVTVFFAHLAELRPEPFVKQMTKEVGPEFVVRALASDHILWSKYIRTKHRWVNGAFILTGMTLGFFVGVGVSYLIRVAFAP
jgi:hypothetical protein